MDPILKYGHILGDWGVMTSTYDTIPLHQGRVYFLGYLWAEMKDTQA